MANTATIYVPTGGAKEKTNGDIELIGVVYTTNINGNTYTHTEKGGKVKSKDLSKMEGETTEDKLRNYLKTKAQEWISHDELAESEKEAEENAATYLDDQTINV